MLQLLSDRNLDTRLDEDNFVDLLYICWGGDLIKTCDVFKTDL
jgi:hypothetical protein